MSKDIYSRLASVLLRAGTLACKFLLVFFLAKYLNPGEVGVYGLIVGAIGYAMFAIGFEFYTYSSRELIGLGSERWLAVIRDQWLFFAITYLAFAPVLWGLFHFGVLPAGHAGMFVVLLVLEHTAQELNRLLIALREQFLASFILFLRSGAWTMVVVAGMWLEPQLRTLDFVFLAWSGGAGIACLLGVARFLRFDRAALRQPVKWSWIGKGVKVSFALLVASLAVRGLFVFDRYWVGSVAGLDVLGAYVLFAGIAFSIISFLDAGVIAFLYPKVVAAAKANDKAGFARHMRELTINVVAATLLMAVAALLVSPYVLQWIGKPLYVQSMALLQWLLVAASLYAFSMIPHVGLYARHRDKVILHSQLAGVVVFVVGCLVAAPARGATAVVGSLILSFIVVFAWKAIAYFALPDMRQASN